MTNKEQEEFLAHGFKLLKISEDFANDLESWQKLCDKCKL